VTGSKQQSTFDLTAQVCFLLQVFYSLDKILMLSHFTYPFKIELKPSIFTYSFSSKKGILPNRNMWK